MKSKLLKLQNFRTNDLVNNGGKQFELGKSWCDDFFEFDKSKTEVFVNLIFKAIQTSHMEFNDKVIELKLAEVSTRGDRKAYVNGPNGMSQIKDFFINDLQLNENKNIKDYFAVYKANESVYYLYFVPSLLYKNFLQFFQSVIPTVSVIQQDDMPTLDKDLSLQQIFYGAPGTGKSYTIDKETKGYAVVRTTFHPDSDYSTFVGAYKPVMEDVDVHVVPVVSNDSGFVFDKNNGSYKEKRIAYKFVKQAFLKAYLGAWKKYADQTELQVSIDAGNGEKWILKSVDEARVDAQKESLMDTERFKEKVKDFWNKKGDEVGNQDHWRATACKWYRSKNVNCENSTADDCWNAIEQALNAGETISETPVKNQKYHIKKGENGYIVINNDNQGATKDKIKELYDSNNESDNSFSIQASIARKLKEFDDTFDIAWNELKKRVNDKNIAPQFLIIEEINRGNCAQIFGDLFQLLDRSDNGFSTYPIEADSDLKDEVARAFKEDDEYKLLSNISIEGAVKCYTSNYGMRLSEDVQEGRVLLLPPNLYIWATMNTSDQSLFPIDSAFKRRWDWKYIPINTRKEQWFVEAENTKYSWSAFLETINAIINEKTSSEDKQLGFYFCKAKGNVIDAETFVSKVVFYLWNDVFKDYGFDGEYFQDPDGGNLEFRKFFNFDGTINEKKVTAFMKNLKIDIEDRDNNSSSDLMITYEGEIIEGKYAINRFLEVIKRAVSDKGAEAVNDCLQSNEFTQSPDKGATRGYEQINESGWYMATNISIDKMKIHLSKLKDNLGINIDFPR